MTRMQNRIFRSCACCLVAFLFLAGHGAPEAGAREARIVVDFIYSDARDFSEGLAAVKSGDLWGYIDHTGRAAIPFTHRVPEVGPFAGGFAFAGNAFIDVEGNVAVRRAKFRSGGALFGGAGCRSVLWAVGLHRPHGKVRHSSLV